MSDLAVKLRQYAAEVHQLAYQVPPAGAGEWELLQLAQRMHAEADLHLRRSPEARMPFPETS